MFSEQFASHTAFDAWHIVAMVISVLAIALCVILLYYRYKALF